MINYRKHPVLKKLVCVGNKHNSNKRKNNNMSSTIKLTDLWQYHPAVKNKQGRLGRTSLFGDGKVLVEYTNDGNWVHPMWEWLSEEDVQLADNNDVSLYYVSGM